MKGTLEAVAALGHGSSGSRRTARAPRWPRPPSLSVSDEMVYEYWRKAWT
jgi:hypothetical protein